MNKQKKKLVSAREGYYPELEKELVDCIIKERIQDSAIGVSWAIEKAKQLNEKHKYVGAEFKYHWVSNVLPRNGMSLQTVQNTRKESVLLAVPKVLAWH